MKSFYNIQNLSTLGKYILGVLALFLLVGLFIPNYVLTHSVGQLKTANGAQLKYIDQPISSYFLESIRNNKGVLCLGTSESTPIKSGNYYDYLNADSTILTDFSVLAGAGRTCGNYFALFLENKASVDGLKVLYQINPVYWRTDLEQPSTSYILRYNSVLELLKIKHIGSVNQMLSQLNTLQIAQYMAADFSRSLKRNYFQNLVYWLSPTSFTNGLKYTNQNIPKFNKLLEATQQQTSEIDTRTGCLSSFKHYDWYKPIKQNSNSFRSQELKDFITLCKQLNIELTCIITPVNHTFIQFYSPNDLAEYTSKVLEIKEILSKNKVPYVATDSISKNSKAFVDHQHYSSYGAYLIYHYSSYGAYLIYQAVKPYYE